MRLPSDAKHAEGWNTAVTNEAGASKQPSLPGISGALSNHLHTPKRVISKAPSPRTGGPIFGQAMQPIPRPLGLLPGTRFDPNRCLLKALNDALGTSRPVAIIGGNHPYFRYYSSFMTSYYGTWKARATIT